MSGVGQESPTTGSETATAGPGTEQVGPDDAEVVQRVLDGDRDAYKTLIRRHQGRLHRFAMGMVKDGDASTDLVQDSFVKAYKSLEACRDPDKFGAWVHQILRNRCRDFLKNIRRDHEPLGDHPTLMSRMNDPESDLERSELRRRLESALDQLPSTHREAFLLKHLEGRTYREMQEMLGASRSALKMRVHRAREDLRSILGPGGGEEPGEEAADDVTSTAARSSSHTEGEVKRSNRRHQ